MASTQVFKEIPVDPAHYQADFREIIDTIIERYGIAEWRAGVLTSEIHGHVGIYAIVGMKMGLRAVEYLEAENKKIKICSGAGLKPPVSCLNDGLQVSTGSSLGHGLISADNTEQPEVSATFECAGKKIKLSLKKEVADRLREEISLGVASYGMPSKKYWAYIKKLALSYWLALDRNEIFIIHNID